MTEPTARTRSHEGLPSARDATMPATVTVLALFTISIGPNANGLPGAVMALLISAAAGLAFFSPTAGALLVNILLSAALLNVSFAPGLGVLAGPIVIAVLATHRKTFLAILLGIWQVAVLSVLSAWAAENPTTIRIATQIMTWYLLILAAYFLGVWIRRMKDRLAEEQTRRVRELAEQRRALARELHDTAVRATTEVVLFAETAAQREGLDPQDAKEFARISRTARLATDELRTLMESLRKREQMSPTLDDLPVRVATWDDILNHTQDRLEAAGLTVRMNVESAAPIPPTLIPILSKAMAEITANVIRHAERTTAVTIMSETGNDGINLLVVNGANKEDTFGLSGGSGLAGIRERISNISGELDARRDGSLFLTHLSIPLRKDPA